MFHFLCEGSEGKAEYAFINFVIDEFWSGEKYTLISADGNKNIKICFYEILDSFQIGDTFILFFDSVETIDDYFVYDLLDFIRTECNSLGVYFRYTTYYCFEELFLTYDDLTNMLSIDNVYKNALIELRISIINNTFDFADKKKLEVWRPLFGNEGFNSRVNSTREQFMTSLCSILLTKVPGRFRLSKSKIGDCWTKSCTCVKRGNFCNSCKYSCKNTSFRFKLASLDSNSVSCLSQPFSTIFD